MGLLAKPVEQGRNISPQRYVKVLTLLLSSGRKLLILMEVELSVILVDTRGPESDRHELYLGLTDSGDVIARCESARTTLVEDGVGAQSADVTIPADDILRADQYHGMITNEVEALDMIDALNDDPNLTGMRLQTRDGVLHDEALVRALAEGLTSKASGGGAEPTW